jgi:hypothetical protein
VWRRRRSEPASGLSEWCRRAVLELAERDGSQPAEKVVLAELLSLRSVLLSVVFQMSKGRQWACVVSG